MTVDVLNDHLPEEFFGRSTDPMIRDNINIYKDANITRFEIVYSEEGIDLFAYASTSNYFLVNQDNLSEIKSHYNIFDSLNPVGENALDPQVKIIPQQYTESPIALKV